jgi:Ca-activated chloride channel family protein
MNSNHQQLGDDDEIRAARLTAYALGELGEHERAAAEAELAASEEAAGAVRSDRLLAGYVYEATCRDLSPGRSASVREAVEKRLDELERAPMAAGKGRAATSAIPMPEAARRRSRRWLGALLAVAACLVVAAIPLSVYVLNHARLPGEPRELAIEPPSPGAATHTWEFQAEQPGAAGTRWPGPAQPSESELLSRASVAPASVPDAKPDAALSYKSPASSPTKAPSGAPAGPAVGGGYPGTGGAGYGMPGGMGGFGAAYGGPGATPGVGWGRNQEMGGTGQKAGGMMMPGAGIGSGAPSGVTQDYYLSKSPMKAIQAMPGSSPSGQVSVGHPAAAGSGRSRDYYGYSTPASSSGGSAYGAAPYGPAPSRAAPYGTSAYSPYDSSRGRTGGSKNKSGRPAIAVSEEEERAGEAGKPLVTVVPPVPAGLMPGMQAGDRPQDHSFFAADGAYFGASGAGGPVAPGTEQYDRIVEHPFRSVLRQPLSTFSIDVDTASYANVRRFLRQGSLPPADAVRIEEMVNYFRYHYPQPEGDDPFSLNLEVAQCPWNEGHRLVRIGLRGREIDRKQRGPSSLVFLLDVSGSMDEPDKLPLVKKAMKMLVQELTEDDRVAIVTYASTTGVRLESTNGSQKEKILQCIESLTAGGSTNGAAGIQLAYELAARHFLPKGTNRIILATDGDLNVGITSDEELVRLIRDKAKTGVMLTVLGVGTGNLKDSKLEKLADKGNGVYAYLDSEREARRVLVEQIAGSLVTIAKDVKIQVEFNPAEVQSYRLVGYENRRLAARDFDNDKKDAGDIGAGHTVTALYEIVPGPARPEAADEKLALKYQRPAKGELAEAASSGELLTLRLRFKRPGEDQSTLCERVLKDNRKRFAQASTDFQFAAAAASFGMLLRGSPYRGNMTFKAVEEIAASSLGDDPGGHRAELLDLVRRAEQLAAHR